MHTLGIVPDPKGREAHFQDFAYLCARLERGWTLRGTAGAKRKEV